jgi:hypothetical protein
MSAAVDSSAAISIRALCDSVVDLDSQAYSGRGMMGRQCLGVQCDSVATFVEQILTVAREQCETLRQLQLTIEGIEDALRGMRQDSLGRNIILYFPGIPFADEEESDDD